MKNGIPQHIAIIMDGNRRWAKEQGKSSFFGHTKGAQNVRTITESCISLGVRYLTLWALSTENVKERDAKELKHLYSLFTQLADYLGDFEKNKIRLKIIGNVSVLPKKVQKVFADLEKRTKEYGALTLVLAVNYGGRDEILRATRAIVEKGIGAEEITEELFSASLDTKGIPEPDLIIRTGGHQRLSGYLPWQAIYAELFFTKTYWPGFTPEELTEIVEWYGGVQRNRGR